jgi:hypothetical protein
MSDRTTQNAPRPTSSAQNPLQQHGYIRCYRYLLKRYGPTVALVYGLLEDYAQLGQRTGRGCVPSHETIAEGLGVSVATIKRSLDTLRSDGLIGWQPETPGGVNHYTLFALNSESDPSSNCTTPSLKLSHNLTPVTNTNTKSARKKEKTTNATSDDVGSATRMKSNWRPPASEIEKMRAELNWTAERIEHEILIFIDYWRGRKDGRIDWVATWRSRMREKASWDRGREQKTQQTDNAIDYALDDEARARDGRAAL